MAHHEYLEHTGEVTLRLAAAELGPLFAEAAVALGELERGTIQPTTEVVVRRIRLEASEPASLLVDWLNELVFLSETESAVPVDATVGLVGRVLDAEVRLAVLARRPALVKAATHHALRLERDQGGWIAEVTLDV